jgi:hypothetical protein
MKKLTLDETWEKCLSMWRWIAKEKREGSRRHTYTLKKVWLKNHGYQANEIDCECFFCHYAWEIKKGDCCDCPPRKLEPDFHCVSINRLYPHWRKNPIAFYNKLVSLNRKRKKSK